MDYKLFITVILISGLNNYVECLVRDMNITADTMVFSTILTVPYVMDVSDNDNGPMTYEGFIVDLWEKMNQAMDNKYEKYRFQAVKDDKYGNVGVDGTWSGMTGEVTRGEVDAAFAPIAITNIRSTVVDFTKPFLNVDTSVLIRKDLNINSLEELLNSTMVTYGCVFGGRTHMLFQESKNALVMQMNTTMSGQEQSPYVAMNEEGAARAIKEEYAFIGESATLDYLAGHHCGMTTFPFRLFPGTGYGIALEKGSRFKSDFNSAIMSLRESGEIQQLYNKWWTDKNRCDDNGTEYSGEGDDFSGGEEGDETGNDSQHQGENGCPQNDVAIVMSVVMSAVVLTWFM